MSIAPRRLLVTAAAVTSLIPACALGAVVGWRCDGSGRFPEATPPVAWGVAGDRSTNVAWRTEMPGDSGSSAVVVGARLFVAASDYDLVCLEKRTGRIMWVRTASPYDAATAEDRARAPDAFAAMDDLARKRDELNLRIARAGASGAYELGLQKQKIQKQIGSKMIRLGRKYRSGSSDGGYANTTPASDGENVYVWFSGVAACYDVEGKRKWITFEPRKWQEHGFHSSPCVAGDKMVVHMRTYLAFDLKTGKLAWESEKFHAGNSLWYNSLVSFSRRGVEYLLCGDGDIRRARDGKLIADTGIAYKVNATPVACDGWACWINDAYTGGGTPFRFFRIPAQLGESFKPAVTQPAGFTPTQDKKAWGGNYSLTASPLVVDGLLYTVSCVGVLYVFDLAAGSLVYSERLDLKAGSPGKRPYSCGVMSSPTLGGKHIYVFGNSGAAAVIEPGRVFELVQRNTIAQEVQNKYDRGPEGFVSSPFFEGNHIFIRGQRHVYCLGAPGKPFVSAAASRKEPKPAARRPATRRTPRAIAPVTDEQKARGLLSIAENYIRAGMVDEAAAKLKQLVERYPDSAQAAEARKKLDALGR